MKLQSIATLSNPNSFLSLFPYTAKKSQFRLENFSKERALVISPVWITDSTFSLNISIILSMFSCYAYR